MHRSQMRCEKVVFLLLALMACLPLLGCQGALVTAYYLMHGTNDEADYPGLKGKKVVVVCKPLIQLQYRNANVARDVSQQVSQLLREHIEKIKVVDQRKVAKWLDENTWEDYTEVGKAMKADIVVGIDLESFGILEGQTLYQGKANVVVHVYECKAGGKEVFTRTMPPAIYPPNTGVPTSDCQEGEFRQKFIQVLAERVARLFYAHDRYADVAEDVGAMKN
jgi:hypothetical protein